MDAKALAKSKRAHSLHLSKKHNPHQKSKTSSIGSGVDSSNKKLNSEQQKQKKQQPRGSRALPSNWDRYEEEVDSDSGDTSQGGTNQPTDVVKPISKGADYAYLISEAKAQYQANSSTDNVPSFDDILGDFYQGLGPLLSAKGKSIESWFAEDTFQVDDEASTKPGASFLSLNLNALAEQLEKVDLSERLFIGPDILPPEMLAEEMRQGGASKSAQEDQAVAGANIAERDAAELSQASASEENKSTKLSHESTQSRTTSKPPTSVDFSYVGIGSKHMNHVKTDEALQFEGTEEVFPRKYDLEMNTIPIGTKPAKFEGTSAEAELDMLLDSFSEIKVIDSETGRGISDQETPASSTLERHSHSAFIQNVTDKATKRAPIPMNYASTLPDLDDALDNLLKETSVAVNLTSESSFSAAKPAQSMEKSQDISKIVPELPNLDDTLDDLLNKTSSAVNSDDGSSSGGHIKAAPLSSSSVSNPVSKPELLDDFDSWLDTL